MHASPPLSRSIVLSRSVRPLILGLATLGAAAAEPAARGAILSWNNVSGGSASTAGNWNPAQAPLAGDDLTFNLLATYAVTYNSSVASSDSHTYKRGTVNITATSPHTIGAGALRVGDVSGDLAGVALVTGTMNIAASSFVGDDSGSAGTLAVNDDDADLILTGATTDLTIGNNGTGTLSITAGGRVVVPDQFIAGAGASSISTVTVSGATASLPFSRSTLDVTGVSQSRFGAGGDVTANISNGALAIFDGDVVVSNGSASTSSVTIAGIGGILPQNATLSVAGDLLLGNNGNGVAAGVATLNVNADGDAIVGDTLVLAGDPQGGSATLHVSDGGLVNTGSMTIGVGATLDLDGGEVQIDGGVLTYTNPAISFEFGGTDHPVIALINGATANFAPTVGLTSMTVGGVPGSPFADFDVRSGSDLTISGNGDLHIGGGASDIVAMTITGVGSTLTLNTNSEMLVGRLGTADFNAELGATVTAPVVSIAPFGGTVGDARFSNPGTTGDFNVIRVGGNGTSQGGSGELYVNAGAVVDTANLLCWPTGVVKVAGATLEVPSDFDCRGVLETHSNAVVNVGGLLSLEGDLVSHPDFAGGVATINGLVQMEIGSTLTLDLGDLTAGDATHVNGFGAADDTLIAVGANTLTLHDLNRARVDDVTINGGHIIAPNGLEIVTPGTNGTLDGTGTITTSELFMESGGSVMTAATAAGIVINGKFRNNSGHIDGTKYTFNNNPAIDDSGWTGAGTIAAQVVFNAGTEIHALANMTMGDGSNFGVTFNAGSELYANTRHITLLDGNGVGMPTVTEMFGGEVTCAQSLTVNSGRVIRGFGDVNSPLLTVFGSMRVGDASPEQIGVLDVNGSLTLGANAETFMHIEGDPVIALTGGPLPQPFDILQGNALALNGALEVRLLNGYSPAVGTVFFVINGTSMTGTFNGLRLQRPGPDRNWLITYHQPGADVSLTVNTCVADISHNGSIDVTDLLAIIAGWGACPDPTLCQADTNGDGQVNVTDLLAIIAQWGPCP